VQRLTQGELRWYPIMLEKPFYEINQVGKLEHMLLRQNNYREFIRDDGSLLFSISINYPSKELDLDQSSFLFPNYEILMHNVHLSVDFVAGNPVYGICHPKDYELSGDKISQEEMAEKLINQYVESIEFDPYSGKEKPKFGFV
jgi:hypothetical protein